MNIVVTGGLGFIGSHLIEALLQKTDANIHCLDNETYAADLIFKNKMSHNKRVFFHKVDICKNEQIKYLSSYLNDIDYLVHLAAESHVDNSINRPEIFVLTNVLGTFNMLELAKHKGIKKFVHVSTDEVYGAIEKNVIENTGFKETDILNPSSVYSSTKASSDLLVNSYLKTYKLDTCITRCCNNYGERQNREKLLPKVIINALADHDIPVYGQGDNVREWIYVKDHCEAIVKVMLEGLPGNIYNIGTANTISNICLVKKVLSILKKDESLISFVEDRKGHDFKYFIDSNKIKQTLSWSPSTDFDIGLKKTIDFYKNNL